MGVSSEAWKYGREYNGLFKAIKSFKQNVSKRSTAQDTPLKKSFLVYFVICLFWLPSATGFRSTGLLFLCQGKVKNKRGGDLLKTQFLKISVKKENQIPYVALSFYKEVWTLSDIFPSWFKKWIRI